MAGGNSSFWCAKWTKNQDTSVNHTELEASLPFPVRSRVGCSSAWLNGTYFDGKSGRELQFDEVSQPGKMCAGTGHQVNDGDHLLHQGQRKLLTHPQRCFKPADCVRWDQPRLAPRDGGAVWFPCSSLDNACFPMPQSPQLSHTPCQSWEGTRVTENLHHPKIRATGGKWPAPQALIDSKQKVLVAGGNHFIWPAEACRQLKKEFLYPVYILFGEGLIIRQEIYRRLSSNKVILIFLGGSLGMQDLNSPTRGTCAPWSGKARSLTNQKTAREIPVIWNYFSREGLEEEPWHGKQHNFSNK